MAFTIKSILKLFMLFLFFQISINFLVEYLPNNIPNISNNDLDYIEYVKFKTNAKLDGTSQGKSLLDNLAESIATENLFDEGIINSFLGVFKIIGQLIRFIIEIGLLILFTPGIIMEILLYNFILSSSILFSLNIIVNIFFNMTLFYIVYKTRTSG